MEMLESKWDTTSVNYFLDNYVEAPNKESFFSNETWKTFFYQQIEAHIAEQVYGETQSSDENLFLVIFPVHFKYSTLASLIFSTMWASIC